ncbi:MAG: nucleoside hydrolase [Chloroflexota bacterium]|nr:MAG: nucleoside hydrolase [Chloroflexota bacterium]
MKKRIAIIIAVALLLIVILVVVGSPLLSALGVELFCIADEDDRPRLVRCGGEEALTADANPPTLSPKARPMLVDTDMAIDDWLAILYLLQRPDVDIRAVTVTGAGEAHCKPGVRNALDLVALAGRPEIPVTCGRETPLQSDRVFPPGWRENVDALSGLSIPANPNRPLDREAAAFITETIADAGGQLEIIALGPLTNLAETFLADPELAREIKQLYIMGGAFTVPGNVSNPPEMGIDNTAAEWNIYVDPHAAGLVVASGAPITFVPLDASNHVPLDQGFYDRLEADRTTPEAKFIYQVLTKNIGFVRSGAYFFWDPLTAAIAADETLASLETHPVTVIEEEGPESGATRLDENGRLVRIATATDGQRFKQHFLDLLNGRLE